MGLEVELGRRVDWVLWTGDWKDVVVRIYGEIGVLGILKEVSIGENFHILIAILA